MQPSYKKFQFKELTGKDGVSPSIQSWQDSGGQMAEQLDVSWNDFTSDWPGRMLGYSYVTSPPGLDVNGKTRLQRIIPYRHPYRPGMWATHLQKCQPINFVGMTTLAGTTGDPYAVFEIVRSDVGFTTLPYNVLSDPGLLAISSPQGTYDESLRFVEKVTTSQSEQIEVQVGSMSYAEMPAGLATPWTTVSMRRHYSVDKDYLSWAWHKVAHLFIMKTGTEIPANLKAARNKVNASTGIGDGSWNGYPPGTLLFKNYQLEPIEAPTDAMNLGLSNDGPPRQWRVKLQFVYFDPDTDPSVVNPHRGHNLVPAPQLSTKYWYYATSNPVNGAGGGVPLYQSVDFRTIFQSPN